MAKVLLAATVLTASLASVYSQNASCTGTQSFYTSKYQALLINGTTLLNYANYKNQVLALTNVASFWGKSMKIDYY